MSSLRVLWQNETAVDINEAAVSAHLEQIAQRLGHHQPTSIELKITTDSMTQKLNQQFLDHDYPTDVLSFPSIQTTPEGPQLLGSIAISAETAKRQATDAGISLQDEIALLSGHGFLHLLGYDHR